MAEAKKTTAKKATVTKVVPKKEVAMTRDYNKYGLYLGIGLVVLVFLSSILGS